jgi:putative ABC transport system permease protein
MNSLWQDIRYGLRMLAKNPGFTAIAMLTLALGIGANTAIFSVVNSVLLRPLPFAQSGRIVTIGESLPGFSNTMPMNTPDYRAFSERQRTFETLAIYGNKHFDLSGEGRPERVEGARISSSLFPLLGVQPTVGRAFTKDEEQAGHNIVILSSGLWKRRFGGDPSILGQTVALDRVPYTVVGVMPAGFEFPLKGQRWNSEPAELWVPMAFTPAEIQGWGNMYNHSVLARLRPGVTLAQAQGDATATMSQIEKLYPAEFVAYLNGRHINASLTSFETAVTGDVRAPLLVLLVAVGVVLLIACANVANLLLARAARRQREVAVRVALGAGRWRLIRQLLSESLLLGVGSGAAALAVGYWGIGGLRMLAPVGLPRINEVSMDGRVLAFAMVLSVGTSILFGIIPALHAVHVDPQQSLKEGGRGAGASRGHRRLQSALIVSQMALAIMLLIGAGLLVRSFARLLRTDPGFRQDRVLAMTVPLPLSAYPHASQIRGFFEELLNRTSSLPGVNSVGLSTDLPLDAQERDAVEIENRDAHGGAEPNVAQSWIMGDYFGAMGITLKSGRMFTPEERVGKPDVAIISESAARLFWPNQNPIGKRLKFVGPQWRTVIGVASDVKDSSMQAEAAPHTYTPYLQEPDDKIEAPTFDELRTLHLAVRTPSHPSAISASLRESVRSLDPQVVVADVKTMESAVRESLAPQRFNLFLLGLFAALAVFLAAVGVYGVLSYAVTQRTREIGVRIALGAQRSSLLGDILRDGMSLTLVGAVLGLAGAFLLTRLMASLLYGVTARDPLTFTAVLILMTLVSLAACYIPARRATRVDPLVALRHE